MFLDPDPRLQRSSGSGFFSSQKPIESPRDRSATWRRKQLPLSERSQSQNNQQNPDSAALKSTVRLVKPAGNEDDRDQDDELWARKENTHTLQHPSSYPTGTAASNLPKPGSRDSTKSSQEFGVSGAHPPTNETPFPKNTRRDNLFPGVIPTRHSSSEWGRSSASSSDFSSISTLQEGESLFGRKSWRTDSRTSQNTTLRGTPTPTELEIRERIAAGEHFNPPSTHALQVVEETSPDVSTVRLVSSPPQSSPSSTSTAIVRPNTSPVLAPRLLRRSSSSISLPETQIIEVFGSSSSPQRQLSQESLVPSDTSQPAPSSPNVVAYYSDSSPPRPQVRPLYAAVSIESIQSRLQSVAAHRPDTARSAATNTSWSSRPASLDELPPLYISKKRLRHKAASSSLNAVAAAPATVRTVQETAMDEGEWDAYPYPRQIFSTHLSTIASESDVHSRTASQQLSHFSLGSGVLTGDDASDAPRPDSWPPAEGHIPGGVTSGVSSPWTNSSSDESRSDMALGRYRDESALPPPLFHARSPSAPLSQSTFEPPPQLVHSQTIRPISRDSEEHFDTVPELAPPQLREQRSGYSLRRRSHSTPSRGNSRAMSMMSMSSRWSQGTQMFPAWARAYYGYGATLMSSSQISLSAPPEHHQTAQKYVIYRDWSDRSTVSRYGSELSEPEPPSTSSSHFLPSIFRPRIRRIRSSNENKRKSKGSRPSPRPSDSIADSMIITPIPNPRDGAQAPTPDQPRYGSLRDHSDSRQPLPRRYTKQKNWDKMEFPRPMTQDGQQDFEGEQPRLVPNKRLGQRVSAWRAPSFAESLDTLLRSRCNRQILLFALGFLCPIFWWTAAVLSLPKKPMSASEFEKAQTLSGSQDDIQVAMMKHEAGDAEKRWREERQWLKARWWRYLNRIMSVIGVLVMSAVISLAVVATKM